jgi:hypothetical protein
MKENLKLTEADRNPAKWMMPLQWIGYLLTILGVVGSVLVLWPTIATMGWLKLHGTDPVLWLAQHQRLHFWSFLLAAYWLGFIARLAVGAWFELRYRQVSEEQRAGLAAGWRTLELAVLICICVILLSSTSAVARVYALLACAFGIILGSFFLQRILVGLKPFSLNRRDGE